MHVRDLTLWELNAAIEGWIEANIPESERAPSDAARDDMIDFLEKYKAQNGD